MQSLRISCPVVWRQASRPRHHASCTRPSAAAFARSAGAALSSQCSSRPARCAALRCAASTAPATSTASSLDADKVMAPQEPVRGRLPTRLKTVAGAMMFCFIVAALQPGQALAAKAAAAAASDQTFLSYLLGFVLHLDKHLGALVLEHGSRTYAILFAIVFAETGLVVTPFLPGDSLLFATGALCALGALSLPKVLLLLFVAAVLGDTVNYAIGSRLGRAVFTPTSRIFRPEYVKKTEEFFARHGAKTIVLARFVPIVRTFAPFVAGVGTMTYSTFVLYNVVGAAVWTVSFTVAGYLFGGLPFVQKNFTLVVLAIVLVSVIPVAWELWQARNEGSS